MLVAETTFFFNACQQKCPCASTTTMINIIKSNISMFPSFHIHIHMCLNNHSNGSRKAWGTVKREEKTLSIFTLATVACFPCLSFSIFTTTTSTVYTYIFVFVSTKGSSYTSIMFLFYVMCRMTTLLITMTNEILSCSSRNSSSNSGGEFLAVPCRLLKLNYYCTYATSIATTQEFFSRERIIKCHY